MYGGLSGQSRRPTSKPVALWPELAAMTRTAEHLSLVARCIRAVQTLVTLGCTEKRRRLEIKYVQVTDKNIQDIDKIHKL